MKSILILFVLFLGGNAMADSQDFNKYFCQEYNRKTGRIGQRSIVLTPLGEGKEKKDEKGRYLGYEAPYLLEQYKGSDTQPTFSAKGAVLTEDVNFQFVSQDGVTNFHIYLDELEESGLTFVKGTQVKASYDYVCRF